LESFCGRKLEFLQGDWGFAGQVETCGLPLCKECAESEDYALFLLGTVGEEKDEDLFSGIDRAGTSSGRLSSVAPNYQKIAKEVRRATNKMLEDLEKASYEAYVSPTDYKALEKASKWRKK